MDAGYIIFNVIFVLYLFILIILSNTLLIKFLEMSNQQVTTDTTSNQTFAEKEQLNSAPQNSTNIQGPIFENNQNMNSVTQTFRPPLPPTHIRPQRLSIPLTQQMLIRQKLPPVCIVL